MTAAKTPSHESAAPASLEGRPRRDHTGQGKIFPPSSPVSVPNLPAAPLTGLLDESAAQSKPVVNNSHRSNWDDNSKPLPHAKNARTYLF